MNEFDEPPGGRERPRPAINSLHARQIRRRILTILYERYFSDPLDMPGPEDLLRDGVEREDLVPNAHYLNDRGLIELLIGYSSPLFTAARITAKGIEVVENRYQFDLMFPPEPSESEFALAEVPVLVERLIEEADFAPIDGEARHCLLRDVQYLRDELARPTSRWRYKVIEAVLEWIGEHVGGSDETLPSLGKLRERLRGRLA